MHSRMLSPNHVQEQSGRKIGEEHGDEAPSSSASSAQEGPARGAAGTGREEVAVVAEPEGRRGKGNVPASLTAAAATKYGAATRIVTVAGLSCPCGGTHVRSTREMEGVRITKAKAKKGTIRVSYTLAPSSSSSSSSSSSRPS
ncbi:unnamed protein product [Ectocarpus sp. CCAP 1310/34]|nr:unnamed protein product [Ectocarpus sp. CCAP 1310/34]